MRQKQTGQTGKPASASAPPGLFVETRTPVGQHRLTTFLGMDFYGDALGVQPDPRMRQAYGELSSILFGGDLLAGQAWSTFADLEAYPNTLDFQGPNSFFGTRQPLVRWTRGIADTVKLKVGVETPGNHIIEGADSLTAWPDGVLSLVWDEAPVHLMGSFVVRDLRASLNEGPTETALGWGGSVSGKVGVPFVAEKDFVTFSITYGEGIGSDFNDQPPDAVFDSAGTGLEAIPVFGYFASFEHWWSRQVNSTIVYGALEADNRDVQSADSFKETQYVSGNLIWTPITNWLLGVEGRGVGGWTKEGMMEPISAPCSPPGILSDGLRVQGRTIQNIQYPPFIKSPPASLFQRGEELGRIFFKRGRNREIFMTITTINKVNV